MARMRCVSAVTLLLCQIVSVFGHGRLIEPPSRSSAWRYGFDTPHNYNDHELYCGGFARQWQRNGGKCGPCGDPWDAPKPRNNEAGGTYGKGVIVRKYKVGEIIHFGVELTANHYGYFEFRLCPNNNPKRAITNACLDKYVLQNVDGGTRYYPGPGSKKFFSKFYLPKDLTCTQCVVQWRYVAGNNWGNCGNGTGAVGCGPQEQFRACADIKIMTEDGFADDSTAVYVPEYEDYNDIDVDTQSGDQFEDANHVGHIVAITMAFVLVTLIFLAVIFYFYWARNAIKSFIKKHASRRAGTAPEDDVPHWKSSVPSALTISNPKSGFVCAPDVPPRRVRSSKIEEEPTSTQIHSISPPSKVTINGVAVTPTHTGPSRIHVPE